MSAFSSETYEDFLLHEAKKLIQQGYYRGVDFYEAIEYLAKDDGEDGQNFERLQRKLVLSSHNTDIVVSQIIDDLHELYVLVAAELINKRYTFSDLKKEFNKWCEYS